MPNQDRLFSDQEILSWISDISNKEISDATKHSLVPFYPQLLVSGTGPYLEDRSGKEYLDCTSQAWTCNIGFSNPDVAFAVST
ncbi:MAG: hypothetical protein ACFFE8_15165, partial [Candidatus Heimdallarchaeota archaeon]